MQNIIQRNKALDRIKNFFTSRDYIHMDTPTLVPSGGVETYLSFFDTTYYDHRGKHWRLQLPTSPEFALKKLVAEGFPAIFQLARAYRNSGELARWHEPEFVMLEWYRVGYSLTQIMKETQELVLTLAEEFANEDIPKNWQVFSIEELFEHRCKLKLAELQEVETFRAEARKICRSITDTDDWDSCFYKVFFDYIEPFLKEQKACHVTHYPRQMGALARISSNPLYVERFETYLYGIELCNGYHELTDVLELTSRFEHIERLRNTSPDHTPIARDFVFENTMAYGLLPCAGNALGVDRLIALVLGRQHIDTLLPLPFSSQFAANTIALE